MGMPSEIANGLGLKCGALGGCVFDAPLPPLLIVVNEDKVELK